jgi:PilZ domain
MVRCHGMGDGTFLKKRRYPRIGLPRGMFVAWQASGKRVVSRVGTLGVGGLYIRTPDPPAVGDNIKLYFDVPGGDVRARAVVRTSYPGRGMGVEFTSMTPEARGEIYRLLRKLLGDGPE